jgi:dipeptidyl aminopeptidase/acylaminoacyl peptidase
VIVFSHCVDGSLWALEPEQLPRLVTQVAGCRYADLSIVGNKVLAVREDHRGVDPQSARAAIVLLPLGSSSSSPQANEGVVLVTGADFYAHPRATSSGDQLAWLEWDHPHMPWDSSRLKLAAMGPDAKLGDEQGVCGGASESILQPEWSPTGVLHFCSDRSGVWNLYSWRDQRAHALLPMADEIGTPPWQLGDSHYGFLTNGELFASVCTQGWRRLALIRPEGLAWLGTVTTKDSVQAYRGGIAYVASEAQQTDCVRWLPRVNGAGSVQISAQIKSPMAPSDVAIAEPIVCQGAEGLPCHVLFYPPRNQAAEGPEGQMPPLVVTCHGGPTSARERGFSPLVQWWTTRGFAVAEVNYSGSSGYGRQYRERLKGRWGQIDVEDCVAAALHLAAAGRVDPRRMVIRGPSSGGFTALASLPNRQVFAAAASHYGVSDLVALIQETHKFESHYVSWLVGPAHSECQLAQRSPLGQVARIQAPVVFFQGLEDKVVPPNQTHAMASALRACGIRAEVHEFAGEGHGFRKQSSLVATLEAELAFFLSVFDEQSSKTALSD